MVCPVDAVVSVDVTVVDVVVGSGVVDVAGEAREYLLYAPANNAEKFPEGSPVVVIWAGNTQSGQVFMDATSWRILADEEGFIWLASRSGIIRFDGRRESVKLIILCINASFARRIVGDYMATACDDLQEVGRHMEKPFRAPILRIPLQAI